MPEGPIVVLGSAVVDLTFRVPELPLPGENAVAHATFHSLGGKGANQATAARRLGPRTVFLGAVGDDDGGRATRADLEGADVDARLKVVPDQPTGHAAVLVDEEGENLLAVHLGANAALRPEDMDAHADVLREARVFVTQLEVPLETVRAAAAFVSDEEAVTILNAAPMTPGAADVLPAFEVAVLNRSEAEQVTGVGLATVDDALAALRALRDMGVREPIVTLGETGAVCLDRGRGFHAASPRVEAVDTTGAGDAFVGALAALLHEGREMADAVVGACRYAALSVARPGTRASYADRAALDALEEDD